MRIGIDILKATVIVCGCSLIIQTVAFAQSTRDRKRTDDSPSEKSLEVRLQKAEELLVEEYKEVAVEFYKQGNKEKSMQMLRRLRQLNPKLEGLRDRIDAISEELMQENANETELDTRKPWEYLGDVEEDKAFRIAAKGDFKLTFSTTVTADGLEIDKDSKDFLPDAPLGCLLGVVVTDGKPGKPFPILSEKEHNPKKSGKLFVKVNVPDGTRCVGKLKIQMSGYILAGRR